MAAVLIGRNEGERLLRCIRSLHGQVATLIYVDSGSTDGSVERATQLGAIVVVLDTSIAFTAARARNTGLAKLVEMGDDGVEFVQFVDGDCQIEPGWIDHARDHLLQNPELAVVAGRRRESAPQTSVYNALCDVEWDTPIGPADAVGGDMMARIAPLRAVGGYRDNMIAGEEPELCLRLRGQGWQIERLDAPMTIHDANITRFGQWWRRARRAGHAFAEGAWLHRNDPQRFWKREVMRALFWGLALPLIALLGAMVLSPLCLLILLVYPLQIARIALRNKGVQQPGPWTRASFLILAKFPEALGALQFHLRRLTGGATRLIEYK